MQQSPPRSVEYHLKIAVLQCAHEHAHGSEGMEALAMVL
jgi:hypothetical protein